MSVVAWDGETLAADRQGTSCDLKSIITKIFRAPRGDVVAFIGDYEEGLRLVEWYNNGQKKADWPLPLPPTEEGALTNLIILNAEGIFVTANYPILQKLEDPYYAWGCGRDLALGAMAMGATAAQGVAVASKFNVFCGGGVEIYKYQPGHIDGSGEDGTTYEITLE
jgi:hypothetical protein